MKMRRTLTICFLAALASAHAQPLLNREELRKMPLDDAVVGLRRQFVFAALEQCVGCVQPGVGLAERRPAEVRPEQLHDRHWHAYDEQQVAEQHLPPL